MSNNQCEQCDAMCCRYFCFEIDKPDSFEEFDDIRWYVLHEGVTVHIDEGDWYISIENRCKALGPGNRCVIYEDRPLICRKYDPEDCDYTQGDYQYEVVFKTPEDVEEYARKALGPEAYERAKAKTRARIEARARNRQSLRRKNRTRAAADR